MHHKSTIAEPLSWQVRLHQLRHPRIVRQALLAAIVVGSLLVLLNQGDLLFSGHMTGAVLMKSFFTPIIPFCVTMLGVFLNTGAGGSAVPKPGWAAIRRSAVIAGLVGSIIIVVNQGDVLLSGSVPLRVWVKVVLTPCVPFCVSLYGAYVAYANPRTAG